MTSKPPRSEAERTAKLIEDLKKSGVQVPAANDEKEILQEEPLTDEEKAAVKEKAKSWLLGEGHQGGLDADTVDGYHAEEIIEEASAKKVVLGGGGGVSGDVTHAESGKFSVVGQQIPAGSTWTLEIPLTSDRYHMGQLILYVPNSIGLSANRRMTAFIVFTTDLNDAVARAGGKSTMIIYGYTIMDYWVKGFFYEDDLRLSENFDYDDNSQAPLLRGTLRIESCQIVSDKIRLTFRNMHATNPAGLTVKGRYHVYH